MKQAEKSSKSLKKEPVKAEEKSKKAVKSKPVIKKQQTLPKRERHQFDLAGKVFGRAAVEVALILSGRNKVSWEPHVDCGDEVTVYNLEKMKIKGGRKLKNKIYYHHSGYPGGIKGTSLEKSIEKDYPQVFRKAVFGMLPKNRLRKAMIKRLKIVKGEITEDKK